MLPNRALAITFVILALMQTAVPIVVQKSSDAPVYHDLFHGAIASCVVTAIVVAFCQAMRRPFSAVTLVVFYVGLALLIAFDIWIECAIDASC